MTVVATPSSPTDAKRKSADSRPSRATPMTITKAATALGEPNRLWRDPLPPGSEIYYRRMDQVVQVIGALMILIAYAAAQAGRWSTDAPAYLWLNLVGSIILAVLAAISA